MKRLLLAAALSVSLTALAATEFQTGLQALRSRDYVKALTALTASAEAGDARAAQLIADMYASGRGVAANPGIALQWRLRAAELGDPGAQYIVGMQYLQGSGVPRDSNPAAYWLDRAARQNHPNAALELGLLQLAGHGDPASGLAWIQQAARQGLFDAQQVLAGIYRSGQSGVPKDVAAAARWEAAAKQNAEVGQQINQAVMQQQNAIAIARSTYYYGPGYAYPWVYPTWGVGWGRYGGSTPYSGRSRYGGWNYGVGVGGVWW
jgi:TPR repeat protein